jgi:4,5:9,10-diseco-3-hydroxy-5,9,17-trioxoandrosta-1(10),2-diene-4-oate hydrolase
LTFDRLAGRLAESRTVYAIDPPGQGGTRVVDPDFAFDTDAIADAIAQFLVALELPPAALIGHSWGGGFAIRVAERHPDRVRRLALLAPAGVRARDAWEFRILRWRGIGEMVARSTSTASVRHMVRKSFANRARMPGRPLIEGVADRLRSGPDAAGLRRDMLRVERHVTWDRTERDLDRVTCPTLILWGDRDRYLPVRLLARFTTNLPHAETHTITGAGHSLHDDAPEYVDPLLDAFLGVEPPA